MSQDSADPTSANPAPVWLLAPLPWGCPAAGGLGLPPPHIDGTFLDGGCSKRSGNPCELAGLYTVFARDGRYRPVTALAQSAEARAEEADLKARGDLCGEAERHEIGVVVGAVAPADLARAHTPCECSAPCAAATAPPTWLAIKGNP